MRQIVVWCLLLILMGTNVLRAATFNVPASDANALKNALRRANVNAEADTINLTNSTYVLTAPDNTINGVNGLPVIIKDVSGLDLTINGNGATLYRSGENSTPAFRLLQIAQNANVVIDNLTFLNGLTADTNANGGNDNSGGAICVHDGILTTTNCSFLSNASSQYYGGAVSVCVPNYRAKFTAQNCYFDSNYAAEGGALHNNGFVGNAETVLNSCVFTNNTSEYGGTVNNNAAFGDTTLTLTDCEFNGNKSGNGGALSTDVFDGTSNVSVSRCFLGFNQATYTGGAINSYIGHQMQQTELNLSITNSTLFDNSCTSSSGQGGAIYCGQQSADEISHVSIENCTFAENSAPFGGSIYNDGVTGSNSSISLANSIFKAGNKGANFLNHNGLFVSKGYNISSDYSGGFLSATGDKVGLQPMLSPTGPEYNGGPTPNIALLPGSPALNGGDPNFDGTPNTDQRGPGYPRVRGGRLDMGAYEAQVPDISIVDAATAKEGSAAAPTSAVFKIQISPVWDKQVTVDYQTVDNTALAGKDYVATSGTLVFAPGETIKTVTVNFIGDSVPEISERFFLDLTNPKDATLSRNRGVAFISNDDGPSLSIDDVAIVEGDTDKLATFTVKLSAPSSLKVSVNVITANGTALSPADYVGGGQTLTFLPGETSKTCAITVHGDKLNEATENFYALLSSPANASVGRGRGVATITDNDLAPSVTVDNVSLYEGNSGARAVGFHLRLSAPSGQVVRVTAATQPAQLSNTGTIEAATASEDYVALAPTQFAFATGQTEILVRVNINGDLKREADEAFLLKLTSPLNATISKDAATCVIQNDDPLLVIANASADELSNESTTMTFTVSLTAPSTQTVTASYSTQDGSAVAGSDYIAQAGTLTFAPGETRKTISVTILSDDVYDYSEYFSIQLSNIKNAVSTQPYAYGYIYSAAPPPPAIVARP